MIKRFSIERSIHILAYLQERTSIHESHRLLKLVYFAERYSMRTYAIPLTYDRYIAMDSGPVGCFFSDLVHMNSKFIATLSKAEKLMVSKGLERIGEDHIKATIPFDPNYVSESDIESLDYAIATFSRFKRTQLEEVSREYPEWKKYSASISDRSTRIPISYEAFFDDPQPMEYFALHRYFKGKDPYQTEKVELLALKTQFMIQCTRT